MLSISLLYPTFSMCLGPEFLKVRSRVTKLQGRGNFSKINKFNKLNQQIIFRMYTKNFSLRLSANVSIRLFNSRVAEFGKV